MCFIFRPISEIHHPSRCTKMESKGRCPDKTIACGTPSKTSSCNSWSGLCFELVALNNVEALKKAAGFSDVATKQYAWRSKTSKPGAQIDLILDRKDGICLMSAGATHIAFRIVFIILDVLLFRHLIRVPSTSNIPAISAWLSFFPANQFHICSLFL